MIYFFKPSTYYDDCSLIFSWIYSSDKSLCFFDGSFSYFSFCIYIYNSFSSSFLISSFLLACFSLYSNFSFFSCSLYSLMTSSSASYRFFYFSASISFYSYYKNKTTLSIGFSLLLLPSDVFSAIFTTSSMLRFSNVSALICI